MTPVNQPTAVQEQYSDQFISTFDIHKPHIRNKLFRQYGDQGLGFFNVLDTLGFKESVNQTEYSHYEEDWIHETLHSRNAIADPGAGVFVDVTLDQNDLDTSNNFYVRVNDDVIFSNQVTGTVISVDTTAPAAPVVRVEPHEQTDNIGAIGQDEEIVIYSNNWAEGTGQPEGRIAKVLKYSFKNKIIKETNEVTGTEMTNATWFNVLAPGGNRIPAYYLKGQLDTDYRMNLGIDGALMFDRPTTNPTLVAAGHRTTYGCVPWVRAGGNVGNYTGGLFTMALFNQMIRRLDKNFAPDEFLSLLGINIHIEWEDIFTDFFDDNPIIFAGSKGRTAKTLNIGFKSFTKAERTFHLKRMRIWNHPKLYGAAGYNINGMALICPLNKVKDPKTSNRMPSIGCRYKKLGNYSRLMETWITGGAGPQRKTSQQDIMQLNMRCEIGSEYFGNKRFFLWEEQ